MEEISTIIGKARKKERSRRQREPKDQQISLFWNAPMEALFGDDTVSSVIGRSIKTLQCDRWRGKGIPYRKCAGRVLYRKADIIAWLEGHKLVTSTSEYSVGGDNHVA